MDQRRMSPGRRILRFFHSLLGRSILFLLCMMVLTLIATGLVIVRSQRALHDEIVLRNTNQVTDASQQMSQALDKIASLQLSMLYDADINRLGVIPDYFSYPQSIFSMLRVSDHMSLIENFSPLVEEAMFIAPSIGKVITGRGVEDIPEGLFESCSGAFSMQYRALSHRDGAICLLMAYPTYLSYLRENGPSYILSLKLDGKALSSFLSAQGVLDDEAMVLFGSEGEVLSAVHPEAVPLDTMEIYEKSLSQDVFDMRGQGRETFLVTAARGQDMAGGLTLVKIQPYDHVFSVLRRQSRSFNLLIVLLILANLLYALHVFNTIHRPIRKLSEAFRQVEQEHFELRLHHTRDDDFAGIYHRFNAMNRRLGELIDQVYIQKIHTQQAELRQLQSQINPHFLYNNLFMIRSLAQLGDTETIETLTEDLGEYFRYVTRVGEQVVPLEKEIAHARNYAAIQDMRFSSRITLTFPELPDAMRDVPVPRLILQPILENAYQHGLKTKTSGGLIRVSYESAGGKHRITVEDNGDGLTDGTLEELKRALNDPGVLETTGLINIHRRLVLKYGEGYGLTLSRSDLGGLRVCMWLPGMHEDAPEHVNGGAGGTRVCGES